MLLRTFSKVYGLVGLRVGFALCGSTSASCTAVDQVRQPFFCNAAAQAAAIEALRHQDAVAERVERAVVARLEVEEGLRALGHRAPPPRRRTSAGSTCPARGRARTPAATRPRVVAGLRERGVLVRAGTRAGPRRAALRVTYGTPRAERALPRARWASCSRPLAAACRRSAAAVRAARRVCFNAERMSSRRPTAPRTSASGAALSGYGFAYRSAWRFS